MAAKSIARRPRPGSLGRTAGPGHASGSGAPGRGRRGAPDLSGPSGPSRAGDPLAGIERVLIDGSNLAYALGRAGAGGGARPAAALVGPLRAAFPDAVRVELVFDGPGAGTGARIATNLFVSYSGRRPADRVIEEAVAAQLTADGPAGTWGILVVSDDRELRDLVRAKGARVAGTGWLATRLDRSLGPGSIGHRRAPRPGPTRSG